MTYLARLIAIGITAYIAFDTLLGAELRIAGLVGKLLARAVK